MHKLTPLSDTLIEKIIEGRLAIRQFVGRPPVSDATKSKPMTRAKKKIRRQMRRASQRRP